MNEFTLASPHIDKPESIRFWFESFKNLQLPRENFHLLIIDMFKGKDQSLLMADFIHKNSQGFKSVTIERFTNKEFENTRTDLYTPGNNFDYFINRRKAVAETMNFINSKRKGHLLLWEDDIITGPEYYYKLKEVFDWSDKFKMITGVSCTRNHSLPNGTILAWNFAVDRVFPQSDTCSEQQIKLLRLDNKQERKNGIEYVGATATGFCLYRSDWLDNYTFRVHETWGQDVCVGHDINDISKHGEVGVDNKVVLNWEIKLAHLGLDKYNRFRVYRTDQCLVDVKDEHGVRY